MCIKSASALQLLTFAFMLLLNTDVKAKEYNWSLWHLQKHLPDCEEKVRQLNLASEILDKAGSYAGDEMRQTFQDALTDAIECAAYLKEKTNQEYAISKDWFGNGFTFKKPSGWQNELTLSQENTRQSKLEEERLRQQAWEEEQQRQRAIERERERQQQELARRQEEYRRLNPPKVPREINKVNCEEVKKITARESTLWKSTGKSRLYWDVELSACVEKGYLPQSLYDAFTRYSRE